MAIGTDRRLPIALGNGLTMNALHEFLRNGVVALAAGLRHVELEDRRFRVLRVENLVGAVAIGTNRGFLRSGGDGVSVYALRIGSDHLRALAAILHNELLTVASAAGRGNVGVMNARLWIAGGQQLVRAAVAIDASRCFIVSTLHGFAVETAVVGSLLVRMATRACDFLGRSLVPGTCYVGVAVDAGKHAAVDRIFKGLRIDVQADGFSVDVVG